MSSLPPATTQRAGKQDSSAADTSSPSPSPSLSSGSRPFILLFGGVCCLLFVMILPDLVAGMSAHRTEFVALQVEPAAEPPRPPSTSAMTLPRPQEETHTPPPTPQTAIIAKSGGEQEQKGEGEPRNARTAAAEKEAGGLAEGKVPEKDVHREVATAAPTAASEAGGEGAQRSLRAGNAGDQQVYFNRTGGGNKCLVIISMNSCQRQRSVPEWSNIPHILSHAYIPANTPTAMFDSVDFLFVTNTGSLGPEELKLSKEAEISNKPIFRDIPNVPNARLVVTGKASSDLSMVQQLYQHVTQDPAVTRYIVLNTGTRGPLVPPEYVVDGNGIKSADGASRYYWVDVAGGAKLVEHMREVVKMAPEGVRSAKASLGMEKNNGQPNYANLVIGSLFSREGPQHLQSYFLSLPPRAFKIYFEKNFNAMDKMAVIGNIEVGTPQRLHGMGFSLYAMGQGMQWNDAARRHYSSTNPAYTSKCARCCLFAKHGGGMWKLQTNEFITELESLTLSMRSHRDAMTIPKLDDASFGQALRQHEAVRHIERMLQRYWCYDASSTYFQPRSAVDRSEHV